MLCVLCDRVLTATAERGLTDCAHEFCLKCICRQLTDRRNLCPVCGSKVKTVHQVLDSDAAGDAAERATAPAPASIRFNNAVYVLNVSIWAVDDPARVLADLFHLEQARLIHKGKLLKKGDVWPGTVVQLFGTRKGTRHTGGDGSRGAYMPWKLLSEACLKRVQSIVCCPFSVVYDFFRSLFVAGDHERRGYQRIDQGAPVAPAGVQQQRAFNEPGRVSTPNLIDSVE